MPSRGSARWTATVSLSSVVFPFFFDGRDAMARGLALLANAALRSSATVAH